MCVPFPYHNHTEAPLGTPMSSMIMSECPTLQDPPHLTSAASCLISCPPNSSQTKPGSAVRTPLILQGQSPPQFPHLSLTLILGKSKTSATPGLCSDPRLGPLGGALALFLYSQWPEFPKHQGSSFSAYSEDLATVSKRFMNSSLPSSEGSRALERVWHECSSDTITSDLPTQGGALVHLGVLGGTPSR